MRRLVWITLLSASILGATAWYWNCRTPPLERMSAILGATLPRWVEPVAAERKLGGRTYVALVRFDAPRLPALVKDCDLIDDPLPTIRVRERGQARMEALRGAESGLVWNHAYRSRDDSMGWEVDVYSDTVGFSYALIARWTNDASDLDSFLYRWFDW